LVSEVAEIDGNIGRGGAPGKIARAVTHSCRRGVPMEGLPEKPNFHCSLNTDMTVSQIAEILRPMNGTIRKCARDEIEVRLPSPNYSSLPK
jgi:hypothetical protein